MFVLAIGAGTAAMAQEVQPAPASQDPRSQSQSQSQSILRAQKRIELRTALSEHRQAEPLTVATQSKQTARQLSPSERATMREQLRRFQPVGLP